MSDANKNEMTALNTPTAIGEDVYKRQPYKRKTPTHQVPLLHP